MTLQSSLSAITRLDQSKQIILISLGPSTFYNPASEVPFFLTAFMSNFSMFICDDHGSVETLLIEMFIASMFKTPFTLLPKGILHDNSSYYKEPVFPIITSFADHEITAGIDSVCLSYASAFLGGSFLPFLTATGWEMLGMTSSDYGFVDVDGDHAFNESIDTYHIAGDLGEYLADQEGDVGLIGDLLNIGIPLGGFPQTVFAAKDMGASNGSTNSTYASRLFCATDASWLDNELTSMTIEGTSTLMFDNLQLGLNVVEYLACGRDPEDCIVVFDEAHLRAESGITEMTSVKMYGTLQNYINWLSTNPILCLFYPIFALYSLRRWIPTEKNKKKLQLKELLESEYNLQQLKFRTSSFFSRKINWYRINKRYKQALTLLYRRVERKIRRLLGNELATVDNIVNAIVNERGTLSKEILLRIRKFFKTMTDLKANKTTIVTEEQFQDLFLEMQWIADNI